MIIYSTKLWLQGNSANWNTILFNIAGWLSEKVEDQIDITTLQNINKRFPNSRVSSAKTVNESFPRLFSVKFAHGDDKVSGRQWVTEIGLRQTEKATQIECSILLKIEETSTSTLPI